MSRSVSCLTLMQGTLLLGPVLCPHALANEAVFETLVSNRSSGNRIDLVSFSEGYTEPEPEDFRSDVIRNLEYLFNISPFDEYASYFNVHAVSIASAQSGADEPFSGVFRDTYFNASFDSWGLGRGLTLPPNDYERRSVSLMRPFREKII